MPSPFLLCMLAPISEIDSNLNGCFRMSLCLGKLSIVEGYRKLYQSFSTIVLRYICVSTVPWYYTKTLVLHSPVWPQESPRMVPPATSSLILLFQSASQMWSFFVCAIVWKKFKKHWFVACWYKNPWGVSARELWGCWEGHCVMAGSLDLTCCVSLNPLSVLY